LNEPHPDLPLTPSWSIDQLKKFISSDPEPTIAFYGGEPLLNIKLIEEVMDNIPAKKWTIQTNGTLLYKLPTKYLKRFDSILISIDGSKEITDYYRGMGTYDKVLHNIKDIKARGFEGDLIARMAVSEKSDIFRDVTFLIESEELGFDHVHWQLDAQWDEGMYSRWKTDFVQWSKEYNKGISKLVDYWLKWMKKGVVKGIVPFLGLYKYIINEKKATLHCQAGLTSFAVRTDGKITFCPLPPEYEFSVLGSIFESRPEKLRNSLELDEPCKSCEVKDLCGGRCMFANKTKLWGEEGFRLVCNTVKHLINELLSILPEIKELIEDGLIEKQVFNYPTYNNTTEIIP